jgi:hypothetical protein
MSYILNMLVCVGMILLDNLLQYLLFIIVIDLSTTFDSIFVSIYNLLFIFMIYFWIKIELKVLIFPTVCTLDEQNGATNPDVQHLVCFLSENIARGLDIIYFLTCSLAESQDWFSR